MPGIWATTWGCIGVLGPPCSCGNADLSGLYCHRGAMVTFRPGLLLRTVSRSMVLLKPGSALMSMSRVATNGHKDAQVLWPGWDPRDMLPLGP